MKRIIILFTVALAFSSCKKDVVQNNAVADNTSATIDYGAIKKTSGKNGSMLIFESWEQFNDTKTILSELTNVYAANYLKPLIEKGLVDDDLSAQVSKDGFNQFQPVLDFCNKLDFQSFYQLAEKKEKVWMAQDVEQLDPVGDPFANMERFESALFNTDGQVMIGKEIFTAPSGQISGKNTSCVEWGDNTRYEYYWYSTWIGNRYREIKGNVGPRPFQAISSTTMRYKKKVGGWDYWFTSPCARVYGKERKNLTSGGCSDETFEISDKNSCLPWGFYVYNYSWHGKAPAWAIKYEGTIRSQHGAPGHAMNHSF